MRKPVFRWMEVRREDCVAQARPGRVLKLRNRYGVLPISELLRIILFSTVALEGVLLCAHAEPFLLTADQLDKLTSTPEGYLDKNLLTSTPEGYLDKNLLTSTPESYLDKNLLTSTPDGYHRAEQHTQVHPVSPGPGTPSPCGQQLAQLDPVSPGPGTQSGRQLTEVQMDTITAGAEAGCLVQPFEPAPLAELFSKFVQSPTSVPGPGGLSVPQPGVPGPAGLSVPQPGVPGPAGLSVPQPGVPGPAGIVKTVY